MHRGKGMKFVGDSRIKSYDKPKLNRDYSEFPGRTESFWPDFLLKEWMTGAVFLIAYLCLTVAHPSPLERVASHLILVIHHYQTGISYSYIKYLNIHSHLVLITHSEQLSYQVSHSVLYY